MQGRLQKSSAPLAQLYYVLLYFCMKIQKVTQSMAKTKEQLEYRHPQGIKWITKKPVFLAGGKTFGTMQDAEQHLRNYEGVGLDIIEMRRHHMKGTDITLFVCDWRKFIELKQQQEQQKEHGSNIRS